MISLCFLHAKVSLDNVQNWKTASQFHKDLTRHTFIYFISTLFVYICIWVYWLLSFIISLHAFFNEKKKNSIDTTTSIDALLKNWKCIVIKKTRNSYAKTSERKNYTIQFTNTKRLIVKYTALRCLNLRDENG